jgi:hypothetical protein
MLLQAGVSIMTLARSIKSLEMAKLLECASPRALFLFARCDAFSVVNPCQSCELRGRTRRRIETPKVSG